MESALLASLPTPSLTGGSEPTREPELMTASAINPSELLSRPVVAENLLSAGSHSSPLPNPGNTMFPKSL